MMNGAFGALALGLAHVIVAEELHDEAWLQTNTVGWPQFRDRLQEYPPERVAAIIDVPQQQIIELARLYATTRPSLIKIADGVQRNLTGGQNVRAICALPALVGQYGQRGGGLAYNAADYIQWDDGVVNRWEDCPPPGRVINMNRLGATLTGEAVDPPVKSLFVFGANPLAASPNAGQILAGLKRHDLFVVVHELFQTDTADYADIILPATSQLEHIDLHKGSGHTVLTYNQPAIPPLAECKSNWEVMRLLAGAMGFDEPWLHQSPDEIIADMMSVLAAKSPAFTGITLDRLKAEHSVPIALKSITPFSDLNFPTPSGKVELYSEQIVLPGWTRCPAGRNSWMAHRLRQMPSVSRSSL